MIASSATLAGAPTIFISYSSADRHLARRVSRRLLYCGARVIIDEADLRPGVFLTEELERQIRLATHLIVIWTEAAASSQWVAREIEFARSAPNLRIVPFLVLPPSRDAPVSNLLGVPFPSCYRFESAFENLRDAILPTGADTLAEERLRQDLATIVEYVPRIAQILRNPVEVLNTTFETTFPSEVGAADFRERNFASLENAFKAWRPESVSVRGLPAAGDPEYHALDFALWCAAQLALLRRDSMTFRTPIEFKAYPGIFAKVFGATQAGYEALIALLSVYPGVASEALHPLIDSSGVHDSSIPGVISLFEEAVAICQADPRTKDQFTPYGTLTWFLAKNIGRLSRHQKFRFFSLIDAHEQGPYPGAPLDVLGVLCKDPDLTEDLVQRICIWVRDGLFDQVNPLRRSDSPALIFGFVAGLFNAGLRKEAEPIVGALQERIKKLFRSAEDDKLVTALRWISKADRLPFEDRRMIDKPYLESVYSAEFEQSPHAKLVESLGRLLIDSVTRNEQVSYAVQITVNSKLQGAGFTQSI